MPGSPRSPKSPVMHLPARVTGGCLQGWPHEHGQVYPLTENSTHQEVDVAGAYQAVAALGAVLAAFRLHCSQEAEPKCQQPGAKSQDPRHGL